MIMIEPYFRYCDIIWGQFSATSKTKLSETASLLFKGTSLSVGQMSISVSGSKRWIEKPFDFVLEMYHPTQFVIGKTSIPNINSLAST